MSLSQMAPMGDPPISNLIDQWYPNNYQYQWPWPQPTQYAHLCPVCKGVQTLTGNFYKQGRPAKNRVTCRTCDGKGMVWG